MPPVFTKKALELKITEESLYCREEGYELLIADVANKVHSSTTSQITPDDYIKGIEEESCVGELMKSPRRAWIAKQLLRHIARYDEQKKSISTFDINYALYDVFGVHFKEDWAARFLKNKSSFSVPERIRIIGTPLLKASGSKTLKAKSLQLLDALALYVNSSPSPEIDSALSGSLDYYFSQIEPNVFFGYLQVTYKEFLNLDPVQKAELFAKAIQKEFPDPQKVETLFKYLTLTEARAFTLECFKVNIEASLPLFESVRLPTLRSAEENSIEYSKDKEAYSMESDFFPNLPQDTPFPTRQKAIDDFLGEPVLVYKTKFWDSVKKQARPTIKKFIWPGDTEVFSIDSGKPGPTTLVFAPHYSEDNPRKMFHWIKDIPLQSGRIILLPEANRAMALANKSTNPMNRIFNRTLLDDRIDYLIIRRVEYLMGLVDGMIGLHDWVGKPPFFISDVVPDRSIGNSGASGPAISPWIPQSVRKIKDVSHKAYAEYYEENNPTMESPPQIQWRVADQAATTLRKLSGRSFPFVYSPISGPESGRADNSTAYMNFFLQKPAMTFEATGRVELGQLHAMATYSLLAAYGHKIAPNFVQVLKNPQPKTDPDLYVGLPVEDPPASIGSGIHYDFSFQDAENRVLEEKRGFGGTKVHFSKRRR